VSGQEMIVSTLNNFEVEVIKTEYENHKPEEFEYSKEFEEIENIELSLLLESWIDKELASLASRCELSNVVILVDKLIDHVDASQSIASDPENNVFLNLYKKAKSEREELLVTNLLYKYLINCKSVYYINWLQSFNLFGKYGSHQNIKNLVSEKYETIDSSELYGVLCFLIPYTSEYGVIEKYLNRTNNEIENSSFKIYLFFLFVKYCNLEESQKILILNSLDNFEYERLDIDSKIRMATIRKDLVGGYVAKQDHEYSYSNIQVIEFLKNNLDKRVPNYIEHLVDTKFTSYYRRTEAILSWTLKYLNNSSSYYATPESKMNVNNKYYQEVFANVFLALGNNVLSYVIDDSNESEILIKTLIDKKLYVKAIEIENFQTVGKRIENYINEVLTLEKADNILKSVSFEYPMYIIETEENHRKINEYFKL